MKSLSRRVGVVAFLLGAAVIAPLHVFGSSCTELGSLNLPHIAITSSVEVAAGVFSPSPEKSPTEHKVYPAAVPAFCRVVGVIHPVPESSIGFEVWLPMYSAWNHRLQGVGNGAYNGRISYGSLENAINLGYAAASTDTGHTGGDVKFVVGHPERVADWGYRAVHVTTEAAKLILNKYYGTAPVHSYFNGCSTGGHQALQEAQRFPDDYDGILAGDAGNDRVHLNVGFLWGFAAAHPNGQLILPDDKLPLIHQAVINACDAKDGVKDGILEDPLACKFDPAVLLCKGPETAACLTSEQVEATKKIYAGPRNPRTGESIIAGYAPGSEVITGGDYTGWKNFITGPKEPSRLDVWKYWVFNNPDWD
jgi:feruloyl esterase